MNWNLKHAIGLLVALLCIALGVAALVHSVHWNLRAWMELSSFLPMVGAVTISYLYPTTVAPTLAQMQNFNMVIATVASTSTADTSAVITHDFALTAAEISQGFPEVEWIPQDQSEITSSWFELSENPNFTILGKGTTAGGTIKVFLKRPHTIVR